MITIWVEPHERSEAIEAYRDRLHPDYINAIRNAPEGERLRLILSVNGDMWVKKEKSCP